MPKISDVAPNKEQILSGIRWLIAVLGAIGLGATVAKYPLFAWLQDPGNMQAVATVLAAIAPLVWSMFRHSDAGQVKATDAMPAVQGVKLQPTAEGAALAAKVASPTVTQ